MAKTSKRATGDLGEDVACKYLINKGFSVLERNYLRKWGEIDIIAEKGAGKAKKLYFIEVKTVTREPSKEIGYRPEDNMTYKKVARLRRAIQTYLIDHKVHSEQVWQFDLACVYLDSEAKRAKVEVLEDLIL